MTRIANARNRLSTTKHCCRAATVGQVLSLATGGIRVGYECRCPTVGLDSQMNFNVWHQGEALWMKSSARCVNITLASA